MVKPKQWGPYALKPIWSANGQRISWGEQEDGSVALVHSTDYDSGGSRGLVIPAEAVCAVSSVLFGTSLRRSIAGISERLQRALDQSPEGEPDAGPPSSSGSGHK